MSPFQTASAAILQRLVCSGCGIFGSAAAPAPFPFWLSFPGVLNLPHLYERLSTFIPFFYMSRSRAAAGAVHAIIMSADKKSRIFFIRLRKIKRIENVCFFDIFKTK
jgi:hypothetical protein